MVDAVDSRVEIMSTGSRNVSRAKKTTAMVGKMMPSTYVDDWRDTMIDAVMSVMYRSAPNGVVTRESLRAGIRGAGSARAERRKLFLSTNSDANVWRDCQMSSSWGETGNTGGVCVCVWGGGDVSKGGRALHPTLCQPVTPLCVKTHVHVPPVVVAALPHLKDAVPGRRRDELDGAPTLGGVGGHHVDVQGLPVKGERFEVKGLRKGWGRKGVCKIARCMEKQTRPKQPRSSSSHRVVGARELDAPHDDVVGLGRMERIGLS